MLAAEDFDGDGRNEIIMGAQFGKPFFYHGGGRGAGEAYMLYGQAKRYSGNYEVNNVGQSTMPGTILTGILPNPNAGDDLVNPEMARAGSSIPYSVDGAVAPAFDSEGLRGVTLIPDQDGDGQQELVFSFPYCNSYSLENQVGVNPDPVIGNGRLENNGHFLRGGVVVVSSRNPLLASRTAVSRHYDRVLQLHQVGQIFSQMLLDPLPPALPAKEDQCGGDGANDTAVFPCEGFMQDTSGGVGAISPPRLATALSAGGLIARNTPLPMCGELISLSQVDSPPGPSEAGFIGARMANDPNQPCLPAFNGTSLPFGEWPPFGFMRVIGSGFYGTGTDCGGRGLANALTPYGCRILGQTSTQCPNPPDCDSYSSRFGHSVSSSGDFLLVGAPLRTARQADVPQLPTATREQCGQIYMLQLRRRTVTQTDNRWQYWATGALPNDSIPAPHNYIIKDVGYRKCEYYNAPPPPGWAMTEMGDPIQIVGASAGDQVGDVTGTYDINGDGVDDVAVGAPGAARMPNETRPRGAVYVIYRRQPELEGNYLLEDLGRDPAADPQRLNGLMIIGQPGENIGRSLAGGGALNDDFNKDGYADLLIGSSDAFTAGGAQSGEVFILFGGRNLLNPAGGITLGELRDAGYGMLLTGAGTGHHAGWTVANAGDFNGDGTPDILISAPDASPSFTFTPGSDGTFAAAGTAHGVDLDGNGKADDLNLDGDPDDLTGAGLVYVVFGGTHLTGTISLSQIGSDNLPGVVFVGRVVGDAMGGGLTQNGLPSKGIASAGDLDGDGRSDLLISSILASPEGKTAAGEVYLIYGFRP